MSKKKKIHAELLKEIEVVDPDTKNVRKVELRNDPVCGAIFVVDPSFRRKDILKNIHADKGIKVDDAELLKEIEVVDPDNKVHKMELWKDLVSGAIFGVDSSFWRKKLAAAKKQKEKGKKGK